MSNIIYTECPIKVIESSVFYSNVFTVIYSNVQAQLHLYHDRLVVKFDLYENKIFMYKDIKCWRTYNILWIMETNDKISHIFITKNPQNISNKILDLTTKLAEYNELF